MSISTIDQMIEKSHLLKHPFYLAWTRGELTLECLQEYAKEYYHHVKAFPTYLSALHAHTEDAAIRKSLLQNLIDEEAGSPNHPELWKEFALGIGVKEEELSHHKPSREMQALIETFRRLCREGDVGQGVAALYAYESQIPSIAQSKIDGLKKHYGATDPKTVSYFQVHIAADEEHAAVERQILEKNLSEQALDAVDQITRRLWDFLSAMCNRHAIHCTL